MKELEKEGWNYTLFLSEDKQLIFSVVCGSVGMYDFVVALNREEQAAYGSRGKAFLGELARTIRENESSYLTRRISL